MSSVALGAEADATSRVLLLPLHIALIAFVLVRSASVRRTNSQTLTLGTRQADLLVRQSLPFILAVLALVGVA